MAKSNIQNITTAQSFQNWFDKTNEMVDLFRTSAVTASVAGDITTGDVNLVGDITTTNLLADTQIKTDSIVAYTGGATVVLGSPLQITSSASEIAATFQYGASGALTRYTNGTSSWDIGIEDNTNLNFIINTGVGATRFELSTAGTLKVPNLETIECSNKPLEKSIDKGDNPVCHLQLSVYGVSSKSHVPWDWCMKWVVNFI